MEPTVAVLEGERAVDPRIEAIRELLKGPTPPPFAGEPPPVALGLLVDVTNTGRLLDLLDELERQDAP